MARELEVGLLIQPVNTSDWERYEAGDFGTPQHVTDNAVWDGIKHVALLAEELGFDMLWMTEHHRTPYGMCPNPLQFLAWLAGRTERIGLGAAVVVLPWHDPVRAAEDIALLDNLASDRPIRIGFGRGAAASEYAHLGIDQGTARERFDEGVDIVRKAILNESFSHDGDIFKIAPTTIRPRPHRPQQLVDEFFCAFVGEPSLRAAARAGLGMCVNVAKDWNLVRADTELFNSIRAEDGRDPIRPMIVQLMYCAESDEEAREAASRYMVDYYGDANRHYRVAEVASVKGYEHYGAGGDGGDAMNPDILAHSLWGTPERILGQIRTLQQQTDLKHLLISGRFGTMPVAEAERSLGLFASEVLPNIGAMQEA